jgi:RND family efflux transporter, MFP subunit
MTTLSRSALGPTALMVLALMLAASPLAGQEEVSPWLGEGLRVELKAPTMVMLSAPLAGVVTEVRVRDGEKVERGALLVRLDERLHSLRVSSARAEREKAEIQLRLVERLHALGSRGARDVEMAQAQYQVAEAEVLLAQEMLNRCRITAPFSATVTELSVKVNQHLPEGAPLLELAEVGPMELEFMMPSTWLTRLAPGADFQVRVDETGLVYPAEVLRHGGKVDPVTQSIRVYGRLTGDSSHLKPGMSGTVLPLDSLADSR